MLNNTFIRPFAISSVLVFGVAIAGAFPKNGWAAIPPSEFILKTWVAKHKGVKHFRIKSTVIAYEQGKPSSTQFSETVTFQLDGKSVKSWASDSAGKKLYFNESKVSQLPLISKIFTVQDVQEAGDALREKRIAARSEAELLTLKTETERLNAEMETLGRFELKGKADPEKVVAWIIGSDERIREDQVFEPRESKPVQNGEVMEPQAWFEKDTFLPVRLVYGEGTVGKDGSSGDFKPSSLYDFKMVNFRLNNEFPFPRSIQVFQKKSPGILFEVKLEDLSVNSPESAESKGHLSQSGARPGFTEAGDSAPPALKELIRTYYSLFRAP